MSHRYNKGRPRHGAPARRHRDAFYEEEPEEEEEEHFTGLDYEGADGPQEVSSKKPKKRKNAYVVVVFLV